MATRSHGRRASRARSAATRSGPGIPGIRFLRESWAELNKVEWPNQQQLVSGTAVVLIACLITGAYLYLNDQVWQWFIQHVVAEVEAEKTQCSAGM